MKSSFLDRYGKRGLTEKTLPPKGAVVCWGRFNPPTKAHGMLFNVASEIAKDKRNTFLLIYSSKTQDSEKNPLSFDDKIKFMRRMFPRFGRAIQGNDDIRTIFDVMFDLYQKGYKEVTLVVGSDREQEFDELLNNYNGKKNKDGRTYFFENGVTVEVAGEDRTAYNGDMSGVSASVARKYAKEDQYTSFANVLPQDFSDSNSKLLYNAIRTGLGLKESAAFNKAVVLERNEEREDFYKSKASVGDTVRIKSTKEEARVVHVGSNYLMVERQDGSKKRYWPRDLIIGEEHGAGEEGTDELVNRYKKDTPGQTPSKKKKKSVKEDILIHRKVGDAAPTLKIRKVDPHVHSMADYVRQIKIDTEVKEETTQEDKLHGEMKSIAEKVDALGRNMRELANLGGGGEVNLRKMADVVRDTLADGASPVWNESLQKFEFKDVVLQGEESDLLFIQEDAPVTDASEYVWIQTGLGTNGDECTVWIEDGT